MSDYNWKMDAPKSILETEKNPKNSLFWANKKKKKKKKTRLVFF